MTKIDNVCSMTDLSSLTAALDNAESVQAFIDQAFETSSATDLPTLDHAVSDLLAQLSIVTQDTSAHVERSITEISKTVPRLTYDLQYMRESADGVRRALERVESRIKTKDTARWTDPLAAKQRKETEQVLDRLTHLDRLKHNLTDARSVLREAESWSTLESETLGYLTSGKYRQAATRLAEASKSIHMFQRSPKEFDMRKGLLVSLQNQLEAELDGTLAAMAAEHEPLKGASARTPDMDLPESSTPLDSEKPDDSEKNTMDLPEMYKIYTLIEREKEFCSIYFKARRQIIQESWKRPVLEETSDPLHLPFTTFLTSFFDTFYSTLESESNAMQLIFPTSPVSFLSTFSQTCVEALDPSFEQRLSQVVEHHANSPSSGLSEMQVLLDAWATTCSFGQRQKVLLDKLFYQDQPSAAIATSPLPLNSPATGTNARNTRSRSGSVSTPTTESRRNSRRFSRSFAAPDLPSTVGDHDQPNAPGQQNSTFPTVESIVGPWDIVLYEPFLPFQTDYVGLEKRHFASLIESNPLFSHTELSSTGKRPGDAFLSRGHQVVEWADQALQRCMTFTLGFGLADLIKAIDYLVELSLSHSKDLLELKSYDHAYSLADASITRRDSLDDLDDLAELDLEGPSTTQDEPIKQFKLALGLLRSCTMTTTLWQDFTSRFDTHLRTTSSSLTALSRGEPVPKTSPFAQTTSSAPTLLKQSGLHRLDLVQLVDSPSCADAFNPIHRLVTDYAAQVQVVAQQAVLSPTIRMLDPYPTIRAWNQPEKPARRVTGAVGGAHQLHVPTFSLSPTDIITSVTENLLDLLRLFEGFVNDPGLAFSLATLRFIDGAMLDKWRQDAEETAVVTHGVVGGDGNGGALVGNGGGSGEGDALSQHREHHRTISNTGSFAAMAPISPLGGATTMASTTTTAAAGSTHQPPKDSSELILTTWVTSTTLAFLSHFTSHTLTSLTPPLSEHGANQLSTDLTYLSTAMRAMDVESPSLQVWSEACQATSVAELKKMQDGEADVVRHVAWLRRWNLEGGEGRM